jgi:hypothetical protein
MRKHFIERGFGGADTVGGKLAYIAPLFIGTTIAGALAMEIQDMLTGKNPRPLYGGDPKVLTKNWIAAIMKGGALGIYGDFLGGTATDNAKSVLGASLGPLPGAVAQAANLTIGNAVQALGDKPTNVLQEGVGFVKGLTPGGNLWFTKAATDHYIFNWLQDQLNPGYNSRMQRRAEKEFGSSYWWAPGAPASQAKVPDVTRIIK